MSHHISETTTTTHYLRYDFFCELRRFMQPDANILNLIAIDKEFGEIDLHDREDRYERRLRSYKRQDRRRRR
jgi:hypothetical protein